RTQRSRGNLAERCCRTAPPGQFGPHRRRAFDSFPRIERIPGKSDMQRMTVIAMAAMLVAAPAFGQGAGSPAPAAATPPVPQHQANPGTAAPAAHAAPAKPAAAASTPELRSAAALALQHDPTYDEGSAQRIREAALSYSDVAVRGGWPA